MKAKHLVMVIGCAWILWSMTEVKSKWWLGTQEVWSSGESYNSLTECTERMKSIISSFKDAWSPALVSNAPLPPGYRIVDKKYIYIFCYPSDFDPRSKTATWW